MMIASCPVINGKRHRSIQENNKDFMKKSGGDKLLMQERCIFWHILERAKKTQVKNKLN